MAKILVIDDEEGIRRELTAFLREEGYSAECAAGGIEALAIMREQCFDIVIVDLMLPDLNGMELLKKIKEDYPNIIVVMITAHGSERKAVEAMKAGAYDEAKIKMKQGDIALFYTDGITEAINSDEMMFGEQRLKNLVSKNSHLNLTDLVNSIREELSGFVGDEPQFDDLTLVALKMT